MAEGESNAGKTVAERFKESEAGAEFPFWYLYVVRCMNPDCVWESEVKDLKIVEEERDFLGQVIKIVFACPKCDGLKLGFVDEG